MSGVRERDRNQKMFRCVYCSKDSQCAQIPGGHYKCSECHAYIVCLECGESWTNEHRCPSVVPAFPPLVVNSRKQYWNREAQSFQVWDSYILIWKNATTPDEEHKANLIPETDDDIKRTFWRTEFTGRTYEEPAHKEEVRCAEADANLVSSLTEDGLHAPVIDLDYGAKLLESSTPGHYHLYLDKPIPWEKYSAVLAALADAGLIEEGYAIASIKAQRSSVRPTGVLKEGSVSEAQVKQLQYENAQLTRVGIDREVLIQRLQNKVKRQDDRLQDLDTAAAQLRGKLFEVESELERTKAQAELLESARELIKMKASDTEVHLEWLHEFEGSHW